MKAVAIGLAVALAVTASAAAEEFVENALWITVKPDLIKAKWPHDANGNLIYGKVLLDCAIGANHFAKDCKVKASEPENPAMERAALDLTSLYQTWKTWDSKLTRATLLVAVEYDEPPQLLRKPTYAQVMAVYPRAAWRRDTIDTATVKCIVQITGITRACSVVSEDRPGAGFGPAALAIAQTFVYTPAMKHGEPVEAEDTLPVAFRTYDYPQSWGTNARTTSVLAGATWSKAPTASEISGLIDKKVGDKFADGNVVMQCGLSKETGKLGECTVATVSPGMTQFVSVASALLPRFQADPAGFAHVKEDVVINLRFAFPDMTSLVWNQRHLTHVQWTRLLAPAPGRPLFPDEAVKSGLKTGSASVDCLVGDDGGLSDCKVAKESAPNLGFGDMAKTIAEASSINPWTDEGLPAGGARVQLPIQMAYDEKLAAAPTPATKP